MGRTHKLVGSSRVVTSLEKVLGGGDGEEVTSGVGNAVAQLCSSWYCWLHRQPEELLRRGQWKRRPRGESTGTLPRPAPRPGRWICGWVQYHLIL